MPIFGVPKDPPPLDLSFKSIAMVDPDYAMGFFDAYVDTSIDDATWHACAQVAFKVKWKS